MSEISIKRPKLKIATKDIEVYKYVGIFNKVKLFGLIKYKLIISPFKHFKYKRNKVYTTELSEPKTFNKNTSNHYMSGSGFYSYKTRCQENAKFIIPKGSKYYLYNNKVYVSDSIKLVKLLE